MIIKTKIIYDSNHIEEYIEEYNPKKSLNISEDSLIVSLNDDISYTKVYKKDSITKASLNYLSKEIYTYIKTTKFVRTFEDLYIEASEYDENNNKMYDIIIEIKGGNNVY